MKYATLKKRAEKLAQERANEAGYEFTVETAKDLTAQDNPKAIADHFLVTVQNGLYRVDFYSAVQPGYLWVARLLIDPQD